ncbi:MAG: cytidyltransferase, partial [Nitrosopumilaceae archaeon]|nr:cytidyltransferase [Nitrosopumilaceae archaeon]
PEILQNIEIFYIPDLDDHKKWIENLDTIVPTYEVVFSNDEMTRHLYSKREIPVVSIPFTNRNHLSGTNIRQKIISDQNWHDLVPSGSKKILENIDAKDRLSGL